MSYLPVDPDTRVVHAWEHPNAPASTLTRCDLRIEWVKWLLFIAPDAVYCDECYPDEYNVLPHQGDPAPLPGTSLTAD